MLLIEEGCGQFDSLYLLLVNSNPSSIGDVSQEVAGGTMKLIFFQFQIKLVLWEMLNDLSNMLAMFSQVPGEDKDVININNNEPLKHVPEYLIHESLEHGR